MVDRPVPCSLQTERVIFLHLPFGSRETSTHRSCPMNMTTPDMGEAESMLAAPGPNSCVNRRL